MENGLGGLCVGYAWPGRRGVGGRLTSTEGPAADS